MVLTLPDIEAHKFHLKKKPTVFTRITLPTVIKNNSGEMFRISLES